MSPLTFPPTALATERRFYIFVVLSFGLFSADIRCSRLSLFAFVRLSLLSVVFRCLRWALMLNVSFAWRVCVSLTSPPLALRNGLPGYTLLVLFSLVVLSSPMVTPMLVMAPPCAS